MAKKERKKPVKIFLKNGSINPKAKRRIAKMADDVWSYAVRDDWAWKCAVCGKSPGDPRGFHAHHFIPRQFYRYRFDIRNGIALCTWDHKSNPETAPHCNAAGWVQWLESHHPSMAAWYDIITKSGMHKEFSATRNWCYYVDRIRELRGYVPEEKFEEICGIGFAAYLKDES